VGDGWVTDLSRLKELMPLADDKAFRAGFRKAKRDAKARFAKWARAVTGQVVDPDSIFDSQIKRIHEYKRQLLNALHIVVLYNRLRENPAAAMPRRSCGNRSDSVSESDSNSDAAAISPGDCA